MLYGLLLSSRTTTCLSLSLFCELPSSELGYTISDKLFLLFCQPDQGLLGRLIKVLDAQRGGLSSQVLHVGSNLILPGQARPIWSNVISINSSSLRANISLFVINQFLSFGSKVINLEKTEN